MQRWVFPNECLFYFRWRCAPFMHVCGVTLLRQPQWRTYPPAWPHRMLKYSVRGDAVYILTRQSVWLSTATPHLHRHHFWSPLRVVKLDWAPPSRPSGIMLGYDVLKRTFGACGSRSEGVTPDVRKASGDGGSIIFGCSFLQCPATHRVCGTSCFQPDQQVIRARCILFCSSWKRFCFSFCS